jgi:hypothetical protein
VLSKCEKQTESGRKFDVLVDTSVGWFYIEPSQRNQIFASDHVAEIEEWWKEAYPHNNLSFSSRASDFAPANAPEHGTACFEYSIAVEVGQRIEDRIAPSMWRIEGLTCAWSVPDPEAGKPNVELFWLEVSDIYVPSLGHEPMEDFDGIVRRVFASARL